MPKPENMSPEIGKNEEAENCFDGTCWESARSSWIYMEMEPRQRECWVDNSSSVLPKPLIHIVNSTSDTDGVSVGVAPFELPEAKSNTDTPPKHVPDLALACMENNAVCDVINEDSADYKHPCTTNQTLLSNSNLIFNKESSFHCPSTGNRESQQRPYGYKPSSTQRSISLDSYPIQRNQYRLIKQSETVHFPHIIRREKAVAFQPHYPEALLKSSVTASPFLHLMPRFPSPAPTGPPSTRTDLETDRESVISMGTVTTLSTTGSCNSLYRIPAKLRKLSSSSSSGNSSWSAITNKNTRLAPDLTKYPTSLHPNLLQDTFSYLWCENHDRDPFNTFSVSESDLTAAIAHLEQQLSSSSKTDNAGRLLSNFAHMSSAMAPSLPTEKYSSDPCSSAAHAAVCMDGIAEHSTSLPFRVQFIMESYCSIYMTRKQDLRELKLLQKQENKQITDLQYKNHVALEAKERKFETDSTALRKTFEQDLDMLYKQQKQIIEKAEQAQQTDMKNAAKKLKTEQDKELKQFREKQKQEMKLLKQELDMLPRDGKKETAQKIRESKQIEMEEKDRLFLESQADRMEKHLKQLADQHRQKIALLESQCLQQKQQLYRAHEASVWEMEKNQLHERHQLLKTQLKDMFFVKRHQMLTRHQKEMENLKRYNQTKEDEMLNRHAMERRRLPKILKSEAKTRALMFKQSLRLSHIGTPEDDKTKIKQFEESEKKRMKAEQLRQEEKHKRQLKALTDKNEATVKELEQLQAEKRKMLMEQETLKIKEIDDQFTGEMNKWKAMLIPRKQALEDQFQQELEEQQSFYADVTSAEGRLPPLHSVLSGTVRSKGRDGTVSSRRSTVL